MDSSAPMSTEGPVYYYIGHQNPVCSNMRCKRENVAPLLARLETVTFHFVDWEEVKNTLCKVLSSPWFPCVIQVNPDGQVLLSQGKPPLVDHVKVHGADINPVDGLYMKRQFLPIATSVSIRDWARELPVPDSLDELVEKIDDDTPSPSDPPN